jgi:hypothetical protein
MLLAGGLDDHGPRWAFALSGSVSTVKAAGQDDGDRCLWMAVSGKRQVGRESARGDVTQREVKRADTTRAGGHGDLRSHRSIVARRHPCSKKADACKT